MSNGGTFKLIANNSFHDRVIMRNDELLTRLKQVRAARAQRLASDPRYTGRSAQELAALPEATPTVDDIELTHVVFVHNTFKPFVSLGFEYLKTPGQNMKRLGSKATFVLPVVGQYVNDVVLHVRLSGMSATHDNDKMRYFEFLGHRLCKNTAFKINTAVIDEYTSEDYNTYYQHKLPHHQRAAYLRNIGHEVPRPAYFTWGDPTLNEYREQKWILDGNQTFKHTHGEIDLWIPLLFWFRDIRNALPNFLISYGRAEVEFDFASARELISIYRSSDGDGTYSEPVMKECELYVNNIFLMPEMHDILAKRMGMQLIRVHRRQDTRLSEPSGRVLLHQIKWPVETLFVSFRPTVNTAGGYVDDNSDSGITITPSQQWHIPLVNEEREIAFPFVTAGNTFSIGYARYMRHYYPVSTMGVIAHGYELYRDDTPVEFYDSVLTQRYSEDYVTPDRGRFMINFGVTPGASQPNGYLNISKSREVYITYTSRYIGKQEFAYSSYTSPSTVTKTVDMSVSADCINFLEYKKEGAALRFML